MDLERRRSSGVAKGGLTTGIIGTSLGALNSLALMGAGINAASRNNDNFGWGNGWNYGNGWYGGYWGPGYGPVPQTVVVNSNEDGNRGYGRNGYHDDCGCSENHLVNRYELGLEQQIAEKDSQIALRDANTYNDQKMLEMYKYVDGQFKDIRSELSRQAVVNQKTIDSFAMAEKDLQCCCDKLAVQIERERDARKCNDDIIVTYANATFYPKSVADVTVGTTNTPQPTYNPLPNCCCNNNNSNNR